MPNYGYLAVRLHLHAIGQPMASLLYFTELFKEFMKQPWPDLVVTGIRDWSGSSSCYKSSKAFSFKALQLKVTVSRN